ncbi:RHS repeat-associated core domain-containing protein [Paenibacillus shenyangensis]|uniref:RHS repeat-associated core domain-containing protein n=1 Tax=Paenibacillus sp. A9 TaxID=1284352 RepID=UPI000AE95A8B|nr:RHS repeat-associated core domain-containing protein [Paenibacillus sp. A9]
MNIVNRLKIPVVWILGLMLVFETIGLPVYAAGKAVSKETFSSVQPPSRTASAPDTDPDQWTTVAKSVYGDVYEEDDTEIDVLEEKLKQLDYSTSNFRMNSFVVQSETSVIPEPEPISELGEDKIYLLLKDGAEPIDIYWIEYLHRITGKDGDQIWKDYQHQKIKWAELEQQYSKASVTEDVYKNVQDDTYGPMLSTKGLNAIRGFTTESSSASAMTLSAALDSALDDMINDQRIDNLGKQQYDENPENTEAISTSSGSLTWNANQIHLPGRDGLDLDIGVRYDSLDTSAFKRKSSKKGTASVYKRSYTYERNDLGMGWSFQLPSVEGGGPNCNYSQFVYHSGTGQSYRLYTAFENTTVDIKKESGSLLTFTRQIPSDEQFSNGELQACYLMKHPNGNREYFSSFGLLIGKVDRYGNTISYHYQDRKVNSEVTEGWGGFVPSYITDTVGRKVTFDYETKLNQGDDFQGENIIVTVYNPQGQPQQKVVYTKSRVKLIQNEKDQGYVPLLQSITNNMQEKQTFDYSLVNASFRFESPKDFVEEPYFLLNQVTSPRSATHYEYEPASRRPGNRGESTEYRIRSRYDVPLLANGSQGNRMNQVDYTYINDYTKYYDINQANGGDRTLYRYSQTAHIKSSTATGGTEITNTYNGKHQLLSTETKNAQGETSTTNYQQFDSTYEYNPTKIQTIQQDANGTVTRYKDITYADWGGTLAETDNLLESDYNNADTKARHTINYTYDPTYHLPLSKSWYQSDNKLISEQYSYNTSGRLQSTTNAAGEVTNYSYESAPSGPNQIQKVTETRKVRDGMNTSVTTTFGADYNYAYPTEQTQTLTNAGKNTQTVRQTMKYDSGTGLLTEQTDSDGRKTTTTYDALGRPTRIVSPSITNLDGTVYAVEDQYAYTNRAYSTEADSVNSGILTIRVDSIRQYTNTATGATTILTRQSSYYDGMGFLRVDETYNGTNGWTRSQYHPDDQGRAVYVIDPAGNTQTAAYDAWGQQMEFTDAQGNLFVNKAELTQHKAKRFAVAADQVAAYRSNPGNAAIQLNYVEQSYDAYGHMIGMLAYQDGSARSQPIRESYTYDLVGNVLSYIDPNNNRNSSGVTTVFTYDGLNRLTSVQDAMDQTSRYDYDGIGSLSKVTISDTTGQNETLYSKDYNELGQMTKKTDPSGNSTDLTYNQRGLNDQQTDRNGTVTNYQYDERGQRTVATLKGTDGSTLQTKSIFGSDGNLLTDRHELYLNGTKTATQTSTIDKLDRVTNLVSTANGYNAQLNVTYDPLDRIMSQKNSLNGNSLFTNYGYDKSRLTQVQTNGGQTRTTAKTANVQYDYTPLGQVRSITFPTLSDGTTLRESMSYDLLNRLSRLTNTKGDQVLSVYNYQYDANGNTTGIKEQVQSGAAQTSTYLYDKLNRLTVVKRADGSETQYTYDLRGNRKTMSDTQELPETEPASYTYDLDDRLTSVTGSKGKIVIQYLSDALRYQKVHGTVTTHYGYDIRDQVVAEKTADHAFAYIRGDRTLVKKDQNNKKDYYYLYNGHGDVVQMVGTDGNLVNSYQYDEWGNIVKQKELISNSFKYAGEAYDEENGLYYLKARYYDPTIGRFLNEDTYEGQITNPLSMNGYTYTHNNPLRYIDPSGHNTIEEAEESDIGGGIGPAPSYSASRAGGGGGGGGRAKSTTSSKESGQKKSNQPKPAPKPDSATNADALAAEQRDQVKQAVKDNKNNTAGLYGFKNGITSDEIISINKVFGGSIEMNGTVSSLLNGATRFDGFWGKTAYITRGIAGGHLFDNGNKRTALAVIEELIKRNNISTGVSKNKMEDIIYQISTGKIKEVSDIEKALRGF